MNLCACESEELSMGLVMCACESEEHEYGVGVGSNSTLLSAGVSTSQ